MKAIEISGVVLFCVLVTECRPEMNEIPATVIDDHSRYEDFVSDHSFPYTAASAWRKHVIDSYSRLALGLSKAEVESILGAPDFSQVFCSKKTSEGCLGSSWTYVFAKLDSNLVNLKKGINVVVYFDIGGKAEWMTSNVDGLKEIGSPMTKSSQQENEADGKTRP